jgi:hypothetical protein
MDLNGDGELSVEEMTNWREKGNGKSIVIDASKIYIGPIETKDLKKNDVVHLSTLQKSKRFSQGRIFGALDLVYDGAGGFTIMPNANNYETGAERGFPWFGGHFLRNTFTKVGDALDGGKNGVDYMIYFKGTVHPAPQLPITPIINRYTW